MDHTDLLRRTLDSGPVTITVKPNKRHTSLVSVDPFTIEINARPIDNAANRELLDYLRNTVGPCRILRGSRSRTKRIARQ